MNEIEEKIFFMNFIDKIKVLKRSHWKKFIRDDIFLDNVARSINIYDKELISFEKNFNTKSILNKTFMCYIRESFYKRYENNVFYQDVIEYVKFSLFL